MVYRGRVENGKVELAPEVQLPDGLEVQVSVDWPKPSDLSLEEDPLYRMTDFAVETGIPDLAANIDHYLYGHPKVGDDG